MTNFSEKELGAIRFIRNTVIHRGSPPTIRELQETLGYKSPYSIQLLLKKLEKKGAVKRGEKYSRNIELFESQEGSNVNAKTVEVPLVGNAPCGTPFLAEENIEMTVPVALDKVRPPHHYFLLRAVGNSMNEKGIQDGDLVLVRQQPVANNGETVVALINDEATIKEFHKTNDSIVLKPRSSDQEHKSMILADNFQIQGVVISVIRGY